MPEGMYLYFADYFFTALQVINDILPKLAKKRTDTLMEFCQDAQFKLELIPSSTTEYVESLTFLDDIQEKVKNDASGIYVVISWNP